VGRVVDVGHFRNSSGRLGRRNTGIPVATKPRMRRIQQGSELTNGRSGPSGQRHSIKYVQFQRTREELFSIDHTLKE